MARRTQTAADRARELRERQDLLLALDENAFAAWCGDVAAMRVDSVPGLVPRLRAESRGLAVNRRLTALLEAERRAIDGLDAVELRERLYAGRLTGQQRHYWMLRRPKEVPRVDGYPVWVAATLVDVID